MQTPPTRSGFGIFALATILVVGSTVPVHSQQRVLPLGDSITAGPQGGPFSPDYNRGGYRYFLERFLEGSEGGSSGFTFTGSVDNPDRSWQGTIASYWGQWYPNAKPLNQNLHSGYLGYTIEQIDALVDDDTIPVAGSDVILLQIGTNNMGTSNTTPATPAEISAWSAVYESLLDRILAKSSTVKVVMAKIPPITTGEQAGDIGVNAARIEPFNEQVVAALCSIYQVAHPGRFFLVDHYSPLDPLNTGDSYDTATNDHDFFIGYGDGVHPYNAGHRKIAASFWRGCQLAKGAAAADLITVNDGDGGDACVLGDGETRSGTRGDWSPFVLASDTPEERAKFYVKLDLSGKPTTWDLARFNLVFWGAPVSWPWFENCCDDAPAATTLQLYGIADGTDDWTEAGLNWANAPGNDVSGNSVTGSYLGDLVIPAGAQTGDIISLSSEELRDFVNLQRGADGLVTFAVVGATPDPGFYPSFQDGDFLDYAPSFLQLTMNGGTEPGPPFRILACDFDLDAAPGPQATITFVSSESQRYRVSWTTGSSFFDKVLESGIQGAAGQSETTVTVNLPLDAGPRLFLRVEQERVEAPE